MGWDLSGIGHPVSVKVCKIPDETLVVHSLASGNALGVLVSVKEERSLRSHEGSSSS